MAELVISTEHCHAILRMMHFIRQVELGIAERYPKGEMRCPTHLSVGQECVPAVLSVLLQHHDLAVSTHRGHAHYLGKGGDLKAMLAEIYGKETGCCKGRGGSMHLIDESVGFMGSTAIVGNTIPIGVGLGLAKKIKQEAGIAVVFVGDGAIEEGVFYESANFAAVSKLPVLFVCENNLYSVYSSLACRQPNERNIFELAQAIGLSAQQTDGNDVYASYQALQQAIVGIKNNEGPAFVELSTYRWLEHCGPHYDNDIGYRTETEYLAHKAQEPIARFEASLLADGHINEQQIADLRASISQEIADAFQFAEQSPLPQPEQAYSPFFAPATAGVQHD